ncbi:hypothetical protein PQ460_18005 [Paenibacillus sp. KACC 21273]|uniref:hypothetical protein n=1 Tax=Paenibacillus sp. KACC 21273 TaxID=3025665 RepID=UPI00236560CE|nr:hypothetical protein [Paenibacillus sp. KACC 21273]WDF49871.1 hypothetical protein PQ460_18005 [Paenibacillus sp. KACC 21273]
MALLWNSELTIKLEKILLNIGNDPKTLRSIAKELGVQIENESHRNSLRYRMKKITKKSPEFEYFGYEGRGYIIAIYTDDFERILSFYKNRLNGLQTLVNKFENGSIKIGKKRKNQPEQLTLFDIDAIN